MDMPTSVTALVPAWQAEAFMPPTLDSLSAQTRGNFNVLVSVDLCADETYAICAHHRGGGCALRRDRSRPVRGHQELRQPQFLPLLVSAGTAGKQLSPCVARPRSTERRRAVAPGRGNTGPIANAAALDRAYPRTHCDAAAAGGWVFAAGRGLLSDPGASLHRRADFGIFRRGSYVSVDTGKYAWAPWLAKTLANTLV